MEFSKCRECGHRVSKMAFSCPGCGAPYPANELLDGWGFEYKSKRTVLGLPLINVSFKVRPNGVPVPAKGFITIGQFGIGLISISQFTTAVYALTQIGIYINNGFGQIIWKISHLL